MEMLEVTLEAGIGMEIIRRLFVYNSSVTPRRVTDNLCD